MSYLPDFDLLCLYPLAGRAEYPQILGATCEPHRISDGDFASATMIQPDNDRGSLAVDLHVEKNLCAEILLVCETTGERRNKQPSACGASPSNSSA